jgi:hypothetical protein
MDPDRALEELRVTIQLYRDRKELGEGWESTAPIAELIVDMMQDLDGWIEDGGFLPKDWDRYNGWIRPNLIERMRMFMTDEQIVTALNGAEASHA